MAKMSTLSYYANSHISLVDKGDHPPTWHTLITNNTIFIMAAEGKAIIFYRCAFFLFYFVSIDERPAM